jgi:hypothetical protein
MKKAFIVGIFVCLCAAALIFRMARRGSSSEIRGHITNHAQVPAMVRSLRPVYPYSVIPGGAYSQPELAAADQKDAVVSQHYADFHVESARLVTLEADRYEFVSYRLHNQIFWTKKRLRIPKGELLLSDGEHFARARCGNRLSSTPQQPVNAMQPSTEALNMPPFSPQTLLQLPLAEVPAEKPAGPEQAAMALAPVANISRRGDGPLVNTPWWPQLGQYFPAMFTPGFIPGTPRTPTSTITPPGNDSKPPGNGLIPPNDPTPPVIPATPPPPALIPEPGTISLACIAIVGCLALLSRMTSKRLGRPRSL